MKEHGSKQLKRKQSLTIKLVITMVGIVCGTILLYWLLNNIFLEKYYLKNKKMELTQAYETINYAAEEGKLLDERFGITMNAMSVNNNINMLILAADRSTIISSLNTSKSLEAQLKEILQSLNDSAADPLKQTKDYVIQREKDSQMNLNYLILWGRLQDGSAVYMRTPIESLQDSAQITNRFMMYLGLVSLAVSIVVIVVLAKSISKPILQISTLSKKMSNLDFESQYEPTKHSAKEIDTLGEHMNELAGTLEQTISELKSANLELKQDIQKKEQLDEMRKEFLSNVSHELKTPLALIQGYAEGLVENVSSDAESRDFYCEVIMDEAGKMNHMVKKLLTLNQLEFGNEQLDITHFDITELIQGVVDAQELMAKQQKVEIQFEQKEPCFVWSDEFKIEEVITNYISNAIHYAKGEQLVRITMEKGEQKLRVNVFNSGEWIPKEEMSRIWEKFYKVDKARTREYGGNGIGLSIVKAIMEQLGEAYGVTNLENGVQFWFEVDRKA